MRPRLQYITLLVFGGLFIAWGAVSFAWSQEHAPKPHCELLAKVKEAVTADGAKVTKATPGMMNFLRGFWLGSETLPGIAPPGDSAEIVEKDGRYLIIFIRGPLACGVVPVDEKIIKRLRSLKTGPTDADGEEI